MKIFGEIIKFLIFIFDWRVLVRILRGQSLFDVVFVSNMRDEFDRSMSHGLNIHGASHFGGARVWMNGVSGRMRILNFLPKDFSDKNKLGHIKKDFISVVEWSRKKGAKVVLLAAGTKRIFERDGEEIIKMFPDMIFTNGDNGTMFLLEQDVFNALQKTGLNKKDINICVIGPYGILGEGIIKSLKRKGFNNIFGVGVKDYLLNNISEKYNIKCYNDFHNFSDIDIVIACTHSEKVCLRSEDIFRIKRKEKKLVVIDVAEPSNFKYKEYKKCKDAVIRQDAGYAYSPYLKYVLGFFTYKALRLRKRTIFGCFAEALALGYAAKVGEYERIQRNNWFFIGEENVEIIKKYFIENKIRSSNPQSFGKIVEGLV